MISQENRKKLLGEAQRRVDAADGGQTSTLANQRNAADKYYRGEPFGDEVAGRSAVVSRDVAQYVDSQMPSLMRIFSSGDEVVVFEPTQPQDEDSAKQATDYVNWVWHQNDGFLRFHNWFKDGLLFKLGTIKIWWDETEERTREIYRDLSDEQLAAMQADGDIEVGEVATSVSLMVGPDGLPVPVQSHEVEVTKTNRAGRVNVANVPPEEFLFGKRTKSDRESDIFAHRTTKTRGDLVAMGFDRDLVEGLSGGSSTDSDTAKIVRFRDVDDGYVGDHDDVEVVEAYFQYDCDGGGQRMYQVTYSGSTELACEEVDDHPFACITPILMPHRLVGMSTADQVMDIQRIKSTVQRNMLDTQYLNLMPQIEAVEGQVNIEDLLTRRPGGVVRTKQAGMIRAIPTTPLGQEPFQMIEYLDTQGEQRTGVTRYNQGLDANSLNKTASGINLIQNAAAQRLELIARVLAETGVKRAFKRILSLVQRHQTKPQMMRLRGTWVPMDPRGWSTSMDMTVTVGLGNGNKDQTLAHIMSLIQLDERIVAMQGGVNGPLVTASNVYAKLKKLVEAAGLRSVETYYTDPDSDEMKSAKQSQGAKPDPKMVEIQGKLELEKMQAQARLATDQAASQQDMALATQRAQLDADLALGKAEIDAQIQREKGALQADLARQKAALDVAEMEAKAAADRRAQEFDLIHSALSSHAEMVMEDRRVRERMEQERRAADDERSAMAAAKPIEDDEDMARGPSDEYKAMATMATSVQGAIDALAQIAAAQQQTQADMVALLRKVAGPKRAVRDATGKIIGSEAVE